MITKLAVFALLATLAVPTLAQTAYVITHHYDEENGRAVDKSQFGTVSLQTGAYHLIASSKDFEYMNCLGFGSDGKLYGLGNGTLTTVGDKGNEGIVGMANIVALHVYLIDTATGALSVKKTFANVIPAGASADSHGVFTGINLPSEVSTWRLFHFDPVTGVMRYGAYTTGLADGLVAADGRGNIYVGENDTQGYSNDVLAKIINPKTGAAVFVGRTHILNVRTGVWAGGRLYTFGQHFREDGREESDRLGVYILNTATGTAKLVAPMPLSPSSTVTAAALVPQVITKIETGLINNHLRRNLPVRPK